MSPAQRSQEMELALAQQRYRDMKVALENIPKGITLNEIKCGYIEHVLAMNDGNRAHAAIDLGIKYDTLRGFLASNDLDIEVGKTGRPRKHKKI